MTTKNKKTAATKKVAVKRNLPKSFFLKPKPIKVVTRKVLEQIADNIYNPETKEYLNLCDGTLQNGPDPVCATRSMHCGLGELYFVVVGRHPEDDKVNESRVVAEIIKRSTIHEYAKLHQKKMDAAWKKINCLDIDDELKGSLRVAMDSFEYSDDQEEEFESLLDNIPTENDRGGENAKDFLFRAKRVAETLRKAAALLPR